MQVMKFSRFFFLILINCSFSGADFELIFGIRIRINERKLFIIGFDEQTVLHNQTPIHTSSKDFIVRNNDDGQTEHLIEFEE